MAVVTEYADQRTELEEKIATYELDKSAKALTSEVEALRTEKAVLEEKAAAYEAEAGYNLPPMGTSGF